MSASPNPIDIHVGKRVRLRRTLLGLSQEKLGEGLGLTFQQIQKYERGTNRIGSSRLYHLSQLLNVPVAYFFDELHPDLSESGAPASASVEASARGSAEADQLSHRETLELVRAYYRIENPQVRKRIFELVKTLARTS